jgi:hypothetical protein
LDCVDHVGAHKFGWNPNGSLKLHNPFSSANSGIFSLGTTLEEYGSLAGDSSFAVDIGRIVGIIP